MTRELIAPVSRSHCDVVQRPRDPVRVPAARLLPRGSRDQRDGDRPHRSVPVVPAGPLRRVRSRVRAARWRAARADRRSRGDVRLRARPGELRLADHGRRSHALARAPVRAARAGGLCAPRERLAPRWRSLAAVLSGLTALSHPHVAAFLALSAFVIAVSRFRSRAALVQLLLVGAGAIARRGAVVADRRRPTRHHAVRRRLGSGGGTDTIVPAIGTLLRWNAWNEPLFPLVSALALAGVVLSLARRELMLPIWIAALAFALPTPFQMISAIPLALLAGIGVAAASLIQLTRRRPAPSRSSASRISRSRRCSRSSACWRVSRPRRGPRCDGSEARRLRRTCARGDDAVLGCGCRGRVATGARSAPERCRASGLRVASRCRRGAGDAARARRRVRTE